MPRIHFQQQLAELKEKLLGMTALAQQSVKASADAYVRRDAGLCQYVTDTEMAINSAQREIDEMAYELLAKEQPMAVDLRFIVAVIKINGDLERIGDQSMGIAVRARDLLGSTAAELPVDIAAMAEYASQMIRRSLNALLNADAATADSVLEMDDEIDRMNREASRRIMDVMLERPELALEGLHAIIVARNLERIADHATNIARDVIFWIRGSDVRHQLDAAVD